MRCLNSDRRRRRESSERTGNGRKKKTFFSAKSEMVVAFVIAGLERVRENRRIVVHLVLSCVFFFSLVSFSPPRRESENEGEVHQITWSIRRIVMGSWCRWVCV